MALLFGAFCCVVILISSRYKSYLKKLVSSSRNSSTEAGDKPRGEILQTSVDKYVKKSLQWASEPKTIMLPDLFVSWAKIPLKMSPHYDAVAIEAEAWFNK
jgi:hypothetical protein